MNAFAIALAAPDAPRIAQIARALGVTDATVSEWRSGRRPIPVPHCVGLERLLNISRCKFRPDDWHLIWPELADTTPAPAATVAGEGADA